MIRIKELREKKGLNMRQTARELGIPYTTYISYEKGDREPNSEMLIELAEFFHCSIDYLLGRSEDVIDTETWDAYAKKVEDEVNAGYESDWKMLRQLFPAITDEDIYPLIHQVVPSIRMMNHEGIKELGKRADELYRLREYMNQETRDAIDEEHRLWEEEQRKKEDPPSE